MRLEKLTIKAQEALGAARDLADQRNHQEVTHEHLHLALLHQEERVAGALLRKLGVEPEAGSRKVEAALEQQPQVRGATADVYVARRLKDLLDEATKQSEKFKDEYISSEHLLLALVA